MSVPDLALVFGAMARESPKLTVLLFTDLVDSSRLKVQLGDADYVAHIARPHNELVRDVFTRSGGAENNYTGDGFLATFDSVADAVNAALLIHHRLATHPWQQETPRVRVAIHLGDTAMLSGVGGGPELIASFAADVCARVMSLAAGGQTLLTRAAFDSARQYIRVHPAAAESADPLELVWLAHGRYVFKGGYEPMEIFEVGVQGQSPLAAPMDGEKGKRLVDAEQQATLGWRPAPELAIPRRADWLIHQKLGEGGFGEVWLARHRRTKAERVFKFCFDAERVRHFKRELTLFKLIREVLGDRPDIAGLLEVELDDPPYFLESEYVREGNLREWADRAGGIDAVPLELRFSMLAEIARAVASAHSVGIIHKDIKPSNILVGRKPQGGPQPMLADFGVGAVADRSLLAAHDITMTGLTQGVLDDSSTSGTRLYQPPETMVGHPPTIQGDVYALGVMLYQLAVGDLATPLGIGWEADVDDEVLREDIRDATHRDPARRIASAAELADRIESLDARRSDRHSLARAQRRARRAKALAWIAGALLLTCAFTGGLLVFSYAQWRRAEENADLARSRLAKANAAMERATHEAARAEQSLALAEDRRRDAEAAQLAERQHRHEAEERRREAELHRDRSQRIAKSLISSLEHMDPSSGGSIEELLSGMAEEIETHYADSPVLQAELLAPLADAYLGNGYYADAVQTCERRLKICTEHLGPDDAVTLNAANSLGIALCRAGRPAESIPLHQSAYDGRKKILGPHHAETLDSLHCLAFSYNEAGQLDKAIPLQKQVLELMTEHLGETHSYTLTALNNLGYAYEHAHRLPEALKLFEKHLELSREHFGRIHPDTLMALNNVAWVHYRMGNHEQAIPLNREMLLGRLQTLGFQHPDTITGLINSLRPLNALKRYDEAVRNLDACFADDEGRRQILPQLSIHYQLQIASAYYGAGRSREGAIFEAPARQSAEALIEDIDSHTPGELYYAGSGLATLARSLSLDDDPETDPQPAAELALKLLVAAVKRGFNDFEQMRRDPDLASLQDDPRLKALLPATDQAPPAESSPQAATAARAESK